MSFRFIPKSVTLNDLERIMAVSLLYFTEFVTDVVVKTIGLPRFQNLLLIVYDHTNTICAIKSAIIWAKQEEAIVCNSLHFRL